MTPQKVYLLRETNNQLLLTNYKPKYLKDQDGWYIKSAYVFLPKKWFRELPRNAIAELTSLEGSSITILKQVVRAKVKEKVRLVPKHVGYTKKERQKVDVALKNRLLNMDMYE